MHYPRGGGREGQLPSWHSPKCGPVTNIQHSESATPRARRILASIVPNTGCSGTAVRSSNEGRKDSLQSRVSFRFISPIFFRNYFRLGQRLLKTTFGDRNSLAASVISTETIDMIFGYKQKQTAVFSRTSPYNIERPPLT